ncbi:hypothetical protein EJB05_12873, partial [Eragrostis curvula]
HIRQSEIHSLFGPWWALNEAHSQNTTASLPVKRLIKRFGFPSPSRALLHSPVSRDSRLPLSSSSITSPLLRPLLNRVGGASGFLRDLAAVVVLPFCGFPPMDKASRCLKSLRGLCVTSCRKDNHREQHADDVADHAREETAASRVEAGASVVVVEVQEHEQHAIVTETIAAMDLTPPVPASETAERSGTGDDANAAAAIKVQTAFRSYLVRVILVLHCATFASSTSWICCEIRWSDMLVGDEQARKELRMLRGIVKLQALVRGQLVRRQRDERLRLLDSDGRQRTTAMTPGRWSPHHPHTEKSKAAVQDGSSSTSPQRHQQSRHNMAESSCHSRALLPLIVSRQQRNPASESEVVMKEEEELPSTPLTFREWALASSSSSGGGAPRGRAAAAAASRGTSAGRQQQRRGARVGRARGAAAPAMSRSPPQGRAQLRAQWRTQEFLLEKALSTDVGAIGRSNAKSTRR